jgi:acetolactate synthase I/II/III large subunit
MTNLSTGLQEAPRPLSLPIKGAVAPMISPRPVYPRAADQIVQFLLQNGVNTVFGLPGGPLFPIYDALMDCPGIRVIDCKHETMAVFAAAAYARATESVGVVLVTSGPGITNSLTGLASAFCDSLPVLMLAGEVPRSQFGRGALQEGSPYSLDVRAMVHSITKATFELTNSRSTGAVMGKALATARSGRKGPVFVSLPLDVTPERVDPARIEAQVSSQFTVEANLLDDVADLLASADHPLILAGSGVRWGRGTEQLLRLAERGSIPVATTPKAKGVFPESHPLALGIYGYGGHPSTRKYLESDVDVLFAVGTGFGEVATNTWNQVIKASKSFIQLDIDAAQIGKNYRVDVGLVGPAEVVLRNLLERTPKRSRLLVVRGVERFTDPSIPPADLLAQIGPPRALWELQACLPKDTIYTIDSGEHTMFGLHYLTLDRPDCFYFAGGLGAMGSGLGAALGVKLGCPDRPVVCICGDGSIPMNGGEILTAAQQKLPLIVAVINNGGYGMVENGLRHLYGRAHSFGTAPLDICAFARGLGARAIRIERPGDILAAGLEAALAEGTPIVLDIAVDPSIQMPAPERLAALKASSAAAGTPELRS